MLLCQNWLRLTNLHGNNSLTTNPILAYIIYWFHNQNVIALICHIVKILQLYKHGLVWFGLFNRISSLIFNAEIQLICKWKIIIISIFTIFQCCNHFLNCTFFIIIICTVIWYQVLLSNSKYFPTDQLDRWPHRMDLGVMVMKEYPTQPRAQELELHHQMEFSVTLRILPG